jgi:hypothetical protein
LIPFTPLRFAPLVKNDRDVLSEKDLTDFVQEIIVILKDAVAQHQLTPTQYSNYINLFRFAAERVFRNTPQHQKEVDTMIRSSLPLPSDAIDEAVERNTAEVTAKVTAEKNKVIFDLQAALDEMTAKYQQLQEEVTLLKQSQTP